jgi:acylphosphatase
VQGVFFRDSARREAERLGVGGWVANRPDGSLELVVEGERGAVERLVGFCRSGPPAAEVEDVEVEDQAPEGRERFEVR